MERSLTGFLRRVRQHAGFNSEVRALQVTRATLAALDMRLAREDSLRIARELPEGLSMLGRENCDGDPTPLDVYGDVSLLLGVREEIAAECAESVCAALAEWLSAETLEHIWSHVDQPMRDLLSPRQVESPELAPTVARSPAVPLSRGHTLSTRGPLSRAAPGAATMDRQLGRSARGDQAQG